MTPTLTLFKKEFRQHGIFAPAMVVMCLLFQAAYSQWCYFNNAAVDVQTYFSLAIVVTALYAGAAAALAYSTEHADNTFTFLRRMPISPLTIALGKTGWVVCGTLLVLLGSLILALIWTGGYLEGQIAAAFSFSIVEALVWGLFWSTRCRSQVHALLGGYLCAAGMLAILGNIFQPGNVAVIDAYIALMPYRAAVMVPVGILAIRGMLRWFEYESKPSVFSRFFPEKMTIHYPQRIQSPFFALVHQHVRHASLIYPLGILCFLALSLACSFFWIVTAVDPSGWESNMLQFTRTHQWEWSFCIIVCIVGTVIFWATIFGHDQKNHSYRFLSRLGIHEGTVWWSRLLPALVLYSPVLIGILGFIITGSLKSGNVGPFGGWFNFCWLGLPYLITIWLAPIAVGAFVSISMRSQMVAIALTSAGLGMLLSWTAIMSTMLGCSAWWSILPIILALLIASRIRAWYWLRENFTWRSRLIPLIPVLGVTLAILLAIPPVRVYSVPNVSWEQIEGYFNKMTLPERPEPATLKALLQYVKEKEDIPPGYTAPDRGSAYYLNEAGTYEEDVLLTYAAYRRNYNRSLADLLAGYRDRNSGYPRQSLFNLLWSYSPWERARSDRALRLYIVAALARSGGLQDAKARALEASYERVRRATIFSFYLPHFYETSFETMQCRRRLQRVVEAIGVWYREYGTLPESLDDLIGTPLAGTPGEFLDALPVHPFTQAPVEYNVNVSKVENLTWNMRYNTYVVRLGAEELPGMHSYPEYRHDSGRYDMLSRNGGTYLRLGGVIFVIEQ